MALLKNFPGISLLLLLLTYTVEGWLYSRWVVTHVNNETIAILEQLTEPISFGILYGMAIAGILLFIVVFTSPIALIAISLDGWLKSDTRAFISIFIGAFAFTIIVQQLSLFARLLVLIASALLLKLDLQLMGWNRWLCTLILAIFCCLGFTGGILAFYIWS